MADAPKAESSSGWGAFEIGIVVLIVIALLSKLDDKNSPTTQTDTQDTALVSDAQYALGIQITSPSKNERIGTTFTLRGVIEGGYWNPNPTDGVVLSYQVIDSQGTPVSTLRSIVKNPAIYNSSYVFEDTGTLSGRPATQTGFVVLVSPSPDSGNQTVSIRIPIRFEK